MKTQKQNGHFGVAGLRKTRAGKSLYHHGSSWCHRFRNGFRPKLSAGVITFLRFEERFQFEKLRFVDGLVWTVGLTVKRKLRFVDGLVWTVGLTVKRKLRFQISPVCCRRGLNETFRVLFQNSKWFIKSRFLRTKRRQTTLILRNCMIEDLFVVHLVINYYRRFL